MTCWDAPVTELFGCQPGYPLNTAQCPVGQGFHNGVDYGCPVGTDVTVNGVVIAKSGATGGPNPVEGFGPHCHVGHWGPNGVIDPGVQGGKSLPGGTITEVHDLNDTNNGKYVRVGMPDGTSWVFLHLSEILVTVGQVLQGGNVDLGKLADLRLAAINQIRTAVGLAPRTDTNGVDDILARVTIVNGDYDNLWKDSLNRTPTAADYAILKQGPKAALYYYETQVKANAPATVNKTVVQNYISQHLT